MHHQVLLPLSINFKALTKARSGTQSTDKCAGKRKWGYRVHGNMEDPDDISAEDLLTKIRRRFGYEQKARVKHVSYKCD